MSEAAGLLKRGLQQLVDESEQFETTVIRFQKSISQRTNEFLNRLGKSDKSLDTASPDFKLLLLKGLERNRLGQVHTLTPKEQRLLLLSFVQLPGPLVIALIHLSERNRKILIKASLRQWGVHTLPKLAEINDGLSKFFREASFPWFIKSGEWIYPHLPIVLLDKYAPSSNEVDLTELETALFDKTPLRRFHNITRLTLAEGFLRAARDAKTFSRAVELISNDANFTWLLPHTTPKDIPPHLAAQEVSVAAVLEALYRLKDSDVRSRCLGMLLQIRKVSDFGDPRRIATSSAWKSIRERVPEAFRSYLTRLNEEDIEFFFENSEIGVDKNRSAFWRKYTESFDETTVILSPDTFNKLIKAFHSKDEHIHRLLSGARTFKNGSNFHALVLKFPSIVCIEFHDTGAACLSLSREEYDDEALGLLKFVPELQLDSLAAITSNTQRCHFRDNGDIRSRWKRAIVGGADSKHWPHTQGWQSKFALRLKQSGVMPNIGKGTSSFHSPDQTLIPNSEKPKATVSIASKPAWKPPLASVTDTRDVLPSSTLSSILQAANVEVIDNRHYFGALWVIGGQELTPMMTELSRRGVEFTFKAEGGGATLKRPGWYTKAKDRDLRREKIRTEPSISSQQQWTEQNLPLAPPNQMTPALAKKIFDWNRINRKFTNRLELGKVKSLEQYIYDSSKGRQIDTNTLQNCETLLKWAIGYGFKP